jgi:hypothetical protein
MKAFAESVGVDVSDVANKSLDEVMLEAAEGFHEAEIQAMQEEFSLFQESVGKDEEFLQEAGVLKTIGDTLKKWWGKIKAFLVKLWAKIVHYFWVVVQWARKTIQAAVQKLHGAKTINVPKSLIQWVSSVEKFSSSDSTAAIKEIQNNINKCETVRETADGKDIIKYSAIEKALKSELKGLDEHKKTISKDKDKEAVPFGTWKKWMDNALKNFEVWKKQADDINKKCQKAIATNDKDLEKYYKDPKSEATKKTILFRGKVLRQTASWASKFFGKYVSLTRWMMGALFHYASYKTDKKEKGIDSTDQETGNEY